MPRYVALLRGLNVGGRHRVKMADLAALFADHGVTDVSTFIQSGNVLFTASAAAAKKLPAEVAAPFEQRFGFASPIVVRSAKQLAALCELHPFADEVDDPKLLHVGFLPKPPKSAAADALLERVEPPELLEVRGADLFIAYPAGSARAKLTPALIDRVLDTVVTARNWNTTTKLMQLASD